MKGKNIMPSPFQVDFNFDPEQRGPFDHRGLRTPSDGDTPIIEQPIRMVSIDTPEKSYGGGQELGQEKLDACRDRLLAGFYDELIPEETKAYLLNKLTADAAAIHIEAAHEATSHFQQFLDSRLQVDDDTRRRLAVFPAGELIDGYGRLLAYIAPWFKREELPPYGDPERRTFNLQMLESGWAALFIIYPSFPRKGDFQSAVDAAADAFNDSRGQWQYGAGFLPGYEYRMCIKLGTQLATAKKGSQRQRFYTREALEANRAALETEGWMISMNAQQSAEQFVETAFQRHCVDIGTKELVGRFRFDLVDPWKRMWLWDKNKTPELLDQLGLWERNT
jgi:endonuclease YncB( thermonuclease family)